MPVVLPCAHLFLLQSKQLKTFSLDSVLKFVLIDIDVLICIPGVDNREKF